MLKIWVITLFPDIFEKHIQHLPISKALNKKVLELNFVNLRDFAVDKRGTVDGAPYGGGPGMILRPEPIYKAINNVINKNINEKFHLIFLTPRGKIYNQKIAQKLSKLANIIIICGRYEGIDQRVIDYFLNSKNKNLQTTQISIGKYVLSGGEVAAMAIIESISRLLEGVIENPQTLNEESFSKSLSFIEYPQYTRPQNWMGLKVPQELTLGNHKKIREWKSQASN